jgi:hypothetical protein
MLRPEAAMALASPVGFFCAPGLQERVAPAEVGFFLGCSLCCEKVEEVAVGVGEPTATDEVSLRSLPSGSGGGTERVLLPFAAATTLSGESGSPGARSSVGESNT